MEDEAGVDAASSASTPLEELQQEDASIWALLRILLSVATLPHIVLIVLLSTVLQVAAVNNFEALSAMGFLALSGGYFLTGLLAGRPTVQRWIRLPEQHEAEGSMPVRLLRSFRICLFPLAMALAVFVSLTALIGEQGALVDLTSLLPWMLSSCFVIWAIVQGRGFGRWLTSVSASKLPERSSREPGLSTRSTVVRFCIVMVPAATLLYLFEVMADSSVAVADVFIGNVPFLALIIIVFAVSWRRTSEARLRASSRTDFHRFSGRWLTLSQFMITWHLLTVWRHQFITPGTAILFIEEFVLMMFTVLMAIWGLTSRSFRSPLKLVSVNNALPMGIAFGYAYAGSVAMLTTVLDNVRAVMMAGHLVVALTFMWMQPRVMNQVMGQAEAAEHIKRVVDQAVVAPEPSPAETVATPEGAGGDETAAQTSVGSSDPTVEETEVIGEEVEWKAPDVLATEVEWDDEIELLD